MSSTVDIAAEAGLPTSSASAAATTAVAAASERLAFFDLMFVLEVVAGAMFFLS